MAAIQGTRNSSSFAGALVVAVAAALLVGGAGGYLVRAMSSPLSGSAGVVDRAPVAAADQLPASVQKYLAPAEAPRFKVDDLIASLSYSAVRTTDLPAWVQQYMAPAEAPRFKVDELIRSLSYAPAQGSRFKSDDVMTIDPFTGYLSGSADDQQIRALLTQARYEGGATVIR